MLTLASRWILTVLPALVPCSVACAGEAFTARYRLEITDQGFATVTVQVEHPPRANLLWSIGGASPDYGKDIRDPRASAGDRALAITALARTVGGRDDQEWRVENRADESFELRYRVTCSKAAHEGPEFEDGSHRPSLFADWAVLFGHAVFLIPDGEGPVHTSLEIEVPEGWPLITDFGAKLETENASKLHWILIAAGNFECMQSTVGGVELLVALRAPRRFTIEHVFDWIRKVVETQVALFGSHPAERFVVLVLPSRPGNYGGSVYGNTIELKFPADETLEDPANVALVAHEHFHLWNGQVIAPTTERPEGHLKWFSEGATTYYEKLTLFRAGLIDLDALVASLNESLRSYWNSPVRALATGERMERSYWTEPGFEDFGYQGGAMRALVIDARLRTLTGGERGLDDLMRSLAAGARAGEPGLDNGRLAAKLGALSGSSWEAFFHASIEGVEELPFDSVCRSVGLAVRKRMVADFQLGFEVEGEFRPHVPVVSVEPGSAAEHAGLRSGDRLAGYGLVWGNPDYEVSLQVERGEQRLDMRYLPRRVLEIPTLELADRTRTRSFFLGQAFSTR